MPFCCLLYPPVWAAVNHCSRRSYYVGMERVNQMEIVASAPATFNVIGEHTDAVGGVVLMGVATPRVRVAVTRTTSGVVEVSSSIDGIEDCSARWSELPITAAGAVSKHAAPQTNLAARFGSIANMLINKQLITREHNGYVVEVSSEFPLGVGLGVVEALECAFALAIVRPHVDDDDAPLRAKLAEALVDTATLLRKQCDDAALVAASSDPREHASVQRVRYEVALRSPGGVSVLDYRDKSLTTAPPLGDVVPVVVNASKPPKPSAELSQMCRFLFDAAHAYGVSEIRHVPDASPRVIEWLTAVHSVKPDSSAPAVPVAQRWLDFLDAETQRAQQTVALLRSRRQREAADVLQQSHCAVAEEFSFPAAADAVGLLAAERGAVAYRAAHGGHSYAVIAYVSSASVDRFIADAEPGLSVLALDPGSRAEVEHCAVC